jgi:hypothetical protein
MFPSYLFVFSFKKRNRASNNQQLKMQQLDQEKLLDMTGIQFAVLYAKEPSLFIIQKLQRVLFIIIF